MSILALISYIIRFQIVFYSSLFNLGKFDQKGLQNSFDQLSNAPPDDNGGVITVPRAPSHFASYPRKILPATFSVTVITQY